MKKNRFIGFVLIKEGDKTNIWRVVNKHHGSILGEVKWFSHWRQYCFMPEPDTVFSWDCLRTIDIFIEEKMLARD